MANPAILTAEQIVAEQLVVKYASRLQFYASFFSDAGPGALMFWFEWPNVPPKIQCRWLDAEECRACPYVRPWFARMELKGGNCFLCVYEQHVPFLHETPVGYRSCIWVPKKKK